MASDTPCETLSPSTDSIRLAIAGSPRKPMPSEAIVMPSWQAARYSSMRSICLSASAAPDLPSSRICSTRLSRARTSANSAATKKPLAATSRATPRRNKNSVIGDRDSLCECYFEDRRRRSSADEAESSIGSGQSVDPAGPLESSKVRRIAPPSRSQPPSSERRSSISSSLRRAILVSVRIASLVPSATEMLFALGLGDSVVAVTHECDYPPGVEQLPHLTRSVIPPGLPASEVDAAVRERTSRGEALYELDAETLEGLDVDLIVTQAVCEVCAVSFDDVRAVAERL